MRSNRIIIYKDLLRRRKFLKKEIYLKIVKSVFQNFQIKNTIRLEMLRKMSIISKKYNISKQNNVCLNSGRVGGVFKNWNSSRHFIKILAKWNLLTNTKIASR